ncbi:MAG: DUF4199 domain-containing protein [Aureispira sp.]|nr:DUF4199 domain-containing protein [Aureispira sp.]
MNNGFRFGLWAAVLSVLYITVLYVSAPTYLITGYERLTLLIFLVLMGIAAYTEREQRPDGFIEFGELLKMTFRVYVIGFFAKFLFIYVLFNYIDTDMIELVKDAQVRIFIENKGIDVPEEIFQQKLKLFIESTHFGPTLLDFLGISLEIIVGAIFAGTISFFFKREAPEY